MDKNQRKLQNLFFKLRKKSYILRVISVFFLLSIFSFLLSFNREFNQTFFNQFNSLKHFLNKKAIFCFFNAILLFIAKDSGLLASSVEKPKAAGRPAQNLAENSQLLQTKNITAVENSQIYPLKKITVEENPQVLVKKVETKEVDKVKPADDSSAEEEDDEEVVGEMEELAIDELNKKFEEFIDRVKQGIKMEALPVVGA
ncbi:uncharacterized protein LOC110105186 [Dendrobium catenatum]|uniref:Uncharacterized protein n=1 Tax=Dendrobium catenatum TaxID=906689 RepID=A0A2I0WDM6_9ASPA|nr:uncharacterized protein LOC110105186 [Dendrobium catenatum]PKU73767.1 hypothetical protein MA16_Dca020766 [Dendrobium catenatum]